MATRNIAKTQQTQLVGDCIKHNAAYRILDAADAKFAIQMFMTPVPP